MGGECSTILYDVECVRKSLSYQFILNDKIEALQLSVYFKNCCLSLIIIHLIRYGCIETQSNTSYGIWNRALQAWSHVCGIRAQLRTGHKQHSVPLSLATILYHPCSQERHSHVGKTSIQKRKYFSQYAAVAQNRNNMISSFYPQETTDLETKKSAEVSS